ncbi:MAG: hypothetical protein GQ477_01100 [Nanohaloarchaea archaeon]|nr:hypothetical protein [Candidatus Nanohaloarchaea archaeon]
MEEKPQDISIKTLLQDHSTSIAQFNERQISAIKYVLKNRKITNKEYRAIFGVTDRTALRDLNVICDAGIFKRIGLTGRDTSYILTRHKPDIKNDILS